jgi:hypothetical protein
MVSFLFDLAREGETYFSTEIEVREDFPLQVAEKRGPVKKRRHADVDRENEPQTHTHNPGYFPNIQWRKKKKTLMTLCISN